MIKALIFDLDGTLLNSLEDLADSSNYALSQLNYPTHSKEEYKYFVGDGIRKLMERILPQDKANEDEIEKLLSIQAPYYAIHYKDKTKPYNNIEQLLYDLKKKNYKLAVVSNKPHNNTLKIIADFFNTDIFDHVTGKKDGYKPKPDSALTEEVIKELGVKPNECIFIGDSGMDMLTAKNAGTHSVGVTWGFRGSEELLSNGAEYLVSEPLEILDVVNHPR